MNKGIVKQRGGLDSYLCCLCMALDMTYDELTCRIGANVVYRAQHEGIALVDIRKIWSYLHIREGVDVFVELRHKPLQTDGVWSGCSASSAISLIRGRRAIIEVESLHVGGEMHYVYWDGQELFDPSNNALYVSVDLKPHYMHLFNESKK